MDTIDFNADERFLWLRFVLNPSATRPAVKDWQRLFLFAQHQALIGVCDPSRFKIEGVDPILALTWMGKSELLRERNTLLSQQSATLSHTLQEAGFRCCILKGQGNAAMYPAELVRMPGDIDVWVEADHDALQEYVRSRFPEQNESFKHVKFPLFVDTDVDMHYTPLKVYHPRHNTRLQEWLENNREQQMTHRVKLAGADADVAIPTPEFNAVYQLGHIMIHAEDQGIGLRQLVDYYFVLKALSGAGQETKQSIINTWKRLGMARMASAVMWIEHEMLGLPKEYLLTTPNERRGRILAADILAGGNFGRYSERQDYERYGHYVKKYADIFHLLKLAPCFPGEALFKLGGKIKTIIRITFKRRWHRR